MNVTVACCARPMLRDMGEAPGGPSAVFVVRAWRESDVPGFRARLTWTLDIESGQTQTSVMDGWDELSETLGHLLKTFSHE